jgi:hypothetical protein
LNLLDLINFTAIIVHHFDVSHTLEEDKKKYDALVDILIKLTEKKPENIRCLVVPSTLALNQAHHTLHAPLLAATAEIASQIEQEAPPCSYQRLLRHAQDPIELKI